MSNFFPFGLKMGNNQSIHIPVPDTGCPLNNHPRWKRVVGAGNSVFCWETADGTSISVHGTNDIVKNLAFGNVSAVDGMVSATIAYVPTGSSNWLLPLAVRMINSGNLLGCRWNDGKFEVVQRRNNTWATKWSGGTPVVGDFVQFIISGNTWKVYVNNSLLVAGVTNIAIAEGYFGLSQHRSGDLDGNTILTGFDLDLGIITNDGLPVTNDGLNVVYFEGV